MVSLSRCKLERAPTMGGRRGRLSAQSQAAILTQKYAAKTTIRGCGKAEQFTEIINEGISISREASPEIVQKPNMQIETVTHAKDKLGEWLDFIHSSSSSRK